jgi:hypothetical protein
MLVTTRSLQRAVPTMTPDEVLQDMRAEFRRTPRPRRYVAGLLVAFAEFLIELDVPGAGFQSLSDLFRRYPQVMEGVSTLTIRTEDGGQKTIRPAYERAHRFFIFESKRLDYPRAQPYATGKWADYRTWLDSMVTFSIAELHRIADEARAFVLAELLPHVFDPTTVRIEPPIFRMLLQDFGFRDRARGETTGAAFQAVVFGYIRADAPHLQVEARKVRTGSARLEGIGDIDAWEGDQLVISAEVKASTVDETIVSNLDFFSAEVRQRGALGMVVADEFRDGARDVVERLGVIPLSRHDLIRIVTLWDPLKQRAALNAFQWVVVHREQNGPLIKRVSDFLTRVGYRAPASSPVSSVTGSS